VPILVAFQLTLSFTARFDTITVVDKISYVITLLAAAAAAMAGLCAYLWYVLPLTHHHPE
jgi:hypothetical protein